MVRFGLAVVSIGLALLLMLGLRKAGLVDDPRPALLVALAASFLYGGLGPGILALILAALVEQDLVLLVAGAALGVLSVGFRRSSKRYDPPASASGDSEAAPGVVRTAPENVLYFADVLNDGEPSSRPLREVTSEATWRFHHEQPLDITLPEDEQVEHLYLYSVLAECNDAFARMYGFRTAADVVGTRLVVFLPPSNQENVAYLRRFIRSGYRLEDAESQEIDRYGHAKYFVNNLVGIFERGQLVGAWGTQRDVTDQKRGPAQEILSRVHSSKSSSQ